MSKHLALNEVILEETTGAKTCIYQMKLNSYLDMGKIKSSGVIVSTGTGSTGILLSAWRPKFSEIDSVEELKLINKSLVIDPSDSRMYYFSWEQWRDPREEISETQLKFLKK